MKNGAESNSEGRVGIQEFAGHLRQTNRISQWKEKREYSDDCWLVLLKWGVMITRPRLIIRFTMCIVFLRAPNRMADHWWRTQETDVRSDWSIARKPVSDRQFYSGKYVLLDSFMALQSLVITPTSHTLLCCVSQLLLLIIYLLYRVGWLRFRVWSRDYVGTDIASIRKSW